MRHVPQLICLPPLLVACIAPMPSHAQEYYTVASVKKQLFPNANHFIERSILLTAEQRKRISRLANTRVSEPQLLVWEAQQDASTLGFVVVDKVTGKHDLIDYAVAVDKAGKILGVEIMAYRELYGQQVRDIHWRKQFHGKTKEDTLELDTDIKNVSGATLSCAHVTRGIRRILFSFEIGYGRQ